MDVVIDLIIDGVKITITKEIVGNDAYEVLEDINSDLNSIKYESTFAIKDIKIK